MKHCKLCGIVNEEDHCALCSSAIDIVMDRTPFECHDVDTISGNLKAIKEYLDSQSGYLTPSPVIAYVYLGFCEK